MQYTDAELKKIIQTTGRDQLIKSLPVLYSIAFEGRSVNMKCNSCVDEAISNLNKWCSIVKDDTEISDDQLITLKETFMKKSEAAAADLNYRFVKGKEDATVVLRTGSGTRIEVTSKNLTNHTGKMLHGHPKYGHLIEYVGPEKETKKKEAESGIVDGAGVSTLKGGATGGKESKPKAEKAKSESKGSKPSTAKKKGTGAGSAKDKPDAVEAFEK